MCVSNGFLKPMVSELLDLCENIAFTQNLHFDVFDFDVGPAVLAKQNFVAHDNADG